MATWLIGGVAIGAMILAGYYSVKKMKKGGCGCGCSGCPEAKRCHGSTSK